MGVDLLLQRLDLGVERGQDGGLGTHGGRVRGGHHWWLAQVGGA